MASVQEVLCGCNDVIFAVMTSGSERRLLVFCLAQIREFLEKIWHRPIDMLLLLLEEGGARGDFI